MYFLLLIFWVLLFGSPSMKGSDQVSTPSLLDAGTLDCPFSSQFLILQCKEVELYYLLSSFLP